MKKIVFLMALITTVTLSAQPIEDDKAEIKESILNYIENFFENNYDDMVRSLHPRLAKRGLNPDGTLSDDVTPEKFRELFSTNPKFPVKHQYNVVENIRVYGDMASASLRTGYPKTRWTEYIHLVKEEGKWKLINVFWEFEK